MQIKRVTIGIIAVFSLLLAGCGLAPEVPASTAPPEINFDGGGEQPPADAQPLPEGDANSFGTATAMAQVQADLEQFNLTATALANPENVAQPEGDQPPPEPTAAPPEPTAVPEPTAMPEPTAVPPPPVANECASPYTVSQGEWVWSIGRKCNIHPDDIIAANNLVSPYLLYPDDIIILPDGARPFPGNE